MLCVGVGASATIASKFSYSQLPLFYKSFYFYQLNEIPSELFQSNNFRPIRNIFNNLDSIQVLLKRISSMIASMSNGSRIDLISLDLVLLSKLLSFARLYFILFRIILFYAQFPFYSAKGDVVRCQYQ